MPTSLGPMSLLSRWSQRLVSLYVPVLLTSMCGGMISLVCPFEVHRLGGSAAAMGAVGAILTATYVIGCLVFGPYADRMNPRDLVRWGLCLQAVAVLWMAFAQTLPVFFVAAGLYGVLTTLFWPPVMGWISTGYEGPSLNRRLSLFNLSWCAGMVVGPLAGGLMYEVHHALPFFAATLLVVLAMAVVMRVRSRGSNEHPGGGGTPHPADDFDAERVALFRPLARVAHLLAYVAMGIFRYQLPSLAVHLGIRTGPVGVALMSLSIAMALTFYRLGRTHRWHYRMVPFFSAQIVLTGSVLSLLLVRTWWHMALCLIVGGVCVGVTYSSNLFYGVSGGRDRAKLMAIHELLLSCGFIVGALGGGWVTAHVAVRAAYPICAALLAAGMAVQWVLLFRAKGLSTTRTGNSPANA